MLIFGDDACGKRRLKEPLLYYHPIMSDAKWGKICISCLSVAGEFAVGVSTSIKGVISG